MRIRPITLSLLLVLAASAAQALPPALLWQAEAPVSPPLSASLVLERDATSVRLQDGRIVKGTAKLKLRAPDGRGLVFVVRDLAGAPLLIGETFDARLEAHGDEPDPATGTLRSTSRPLERTSFPLRFPMPPGAHDVALYEQPARANPPSVESLRESDDDLILLGIAKLPVPQ